MYLRWLVHTGCYACLRARAWSSQLCHQPVSAGFHYQTSAATDFI